MTEYLAVALSVSPYLQIYNASTWGIVSGTTTLAGPDKKCAWSNDGSLLAVVHETTPFLTVIDTSDWSVVTGTPTLSGTGFGVHFSYDGEWLAVANLSSIYWARRIRVYNTSDWSTELDDHDVPDNSMVCVCFSPDDSLLAYAYEDDERLVVLNTSDWSVVTGTPDLDTGFGREVLHLAFSNDGSMLAIGLTRVSDGATVLVYNTSDWSQVTGITAPLAYCRQVEWSADDSNLFVAHDRVSSTTLTIYDTSDWSKVTKDTETQLYTLSLNDDESTLAVGSYQVPRLELYDVSEGTFIADTPETIPTSGTVMDVAFSLLPPNHTFRTTERFVEGIYGWAFPDIFEGIAITHEGTIYSEYAGNAAQLTTYKKVGESYRKWDELAPIGSGSHQMALFSAGTRFIMIGAETPDDIAKSTRVYGRYNDLEERFLPGLISSGGITLSISRSDDGQYIIVSYWDQYGMSFGFMYWGVDWETGQSAYIRGTVSGVDNKRYYRRAEISPDGEYVVYTTSHSALYDQSPYIWVYRNDRSTPPGDFTEVDVELGATTFQTSYGLQITWSPNSEYFIVDKSLFKYNSTESRFEIVATFQYTMSWNYKNAWSPDSIYIAAPLGSSVYFYKRSGDTVPYLSNISAGATVTAVCWSKDGTQLFIGTASGLLVYDQDGDTFTLNTDDDFSDIDGAVVSITTSQGATIQEAGTLSVEEKLDISGTFLGAISTAGTFKTTERFVEGIAHTLSFNIAQAMSHTENLLCSGVLALFDILQAGTFRTTERFQSGITTRLWAIIRKYLRSIVSFGFELNDKMFVGLGIMKQQKIEYQLGTFQQEYEVLRNLLSRGDHVPALQLNVLSILDGIAKVQSLRSELADSIAVYQKVLETLSRGDYTETKQSVSIGLFEEIVKNQSVMNEQSDSISNPQKIIELLSRGDFTEAKQNMNIALSAEINKIHNVINELSSSLTVANANMNMFSRGDFTANKQSIVTNLPEEIVVIEKQINELSGSVSEIQSVIAMLSRGDNIGSTQASINTLSDAINVQVSKLNELSGSVQSMQSVIAMLSRGDNIGSTQLNSISLAEEIKKALAGINEIGVALKVLQQMKITLSGDSAEVRQALQTSLGLYNDIQKSQSILIDNTPASKIFYPS